MPVQQVFDVPATSAFDSTLSEALARAQASNATTVVLVTSDSPNGAPWCPDCRHADPVVDAVLAAHPGPIVLVRAECKRSEYAGNASYAYRKHAQLRLTAIPTLYKWTAKGPSNKLVEGQCANKQLVALLLNEG